MSGKVYFLGAGPGDPELLTRKAWDLLTTAEIVLHDALVAPDILRIAPAGAVVRDVGKRCGKKSISQEEIHALLIGYASAGKRVVRLQGGDPVIFGRVAEEIDALLAANIDFEIVPGVTSASAAAAAAGISLTDRRHASKVVFLSGHRRAGEFERELQSIPASSATYVIYMPGTDYVRIVRKLAAAGIDLEMPCMVVSQASTPAQLIYRGKLSSLTDTPPLPTPALLIVGAVAATADRETATSRATKAKE
jgi:uroporphyrin-III C-methyltransferase